MTCSLLLTSLSFRLSYPRLLILCITKGICFLGNPSSKVHTVGTYSLEVRALMRLLRSWDSFYETLGPYCLPGLMEVNTNHTIICQLLSFPLLGKPITCVGLFFITAILHTFIFITHDLPLPKACLSGSGCVRFYPRFTDWWPVATVGEMHFLVHLQGRGFRPASNLKLSWPNNIRPVSSSHGRYSASFEKTNRTMMV